MSCPGCGHVHAGPNLGGICIGCPCPVQSSTPGGQLEELTRARSSARARSSEPLSPGPWKWAYNRGLPDVLVSPDAEAVIVQERGVAVSEANARLIAEAPMLLEAVRLALAWADAMSDISPDAREVARIWRERIRWIEEGDAP